jgi:hypothetical protein
VTFTYIVVTFTYIVLSSHDPAASVVLPLQHQFTQQSARNTMVYNLAYRRPQRQAARASTESVTGEHKQLSIRESVRTGSSGMSHGIPEALSFDRIIAGGVCPVSLITAFITCRSFLHNETPVPRPSSNADYIQPCTVRDFMNFLKYIELSAENLQFFLWYRDYSKRFNELPEGEKVLSPEWAGASNINGDASKPVVQKAHPEVSAMLDGTDFDSEPTGQQNEKNPFYTPPRTPSNGSPRREESLDSYDDSMATGKVNHSERAAGAFENAGLKWKPCELY